MITLDNVSKSYNQGRTYAVREVSLTIEQGELLVLLGESGCGKTTTLKMINRLIELTGGRISVDGEDISTVDPVQLRRRIGYIFQGIGLFPHYTVAENIAMVPHLLGWSQDDVDNRVRELLELVNLDAALFANRRPTELSGGQKQRVGVARALAARPRLMLMDEPFGALDPITRDGLQDEFKQLHRSLGLTVVMVTHDMTEALLMADRIAIMSDGKLLQVDTPHNLMSSPAHEYVEALLSTPKRQADRLEEIAGEAEGDQR